MAQDNDHTNGAKKPEEPAYVMSNEELKFLMKALWESLIAPDWTKDPLVELGKVIFTKVSLKEMDDKKFELLFPYLKKMTETLGSKLSAEADRKIAEEMAKVEAAAGTAASSKPTPTPAPEATDEGDESGQDAPA